jgi:hypothetical protein
MRIQSQIHELHRQRFIFSLALAAGVAAGVPSLFIGGNDAHPLQLLAVLGGGAAWWGVAAFFAWSAVRDSRYSLLRSAALMTLGFALGDLVAFGFHLLNAWAQTDGDFAHAYLDAPLGTTLPGVIIPIVLRVPMRFIISAGLLALARTVLDRRRPSETVAA